MKKIDTTNTWINLYNSDKYKAYRYKTLLVKLKKLGVLDLPKNSRILDVACGSGEALDILYEQGFRKLYGVDQNSYSYTDTSKYKISIGAVDGLFFETSNFDAIIITHALHHLGDFNQLRSLLITIKSLLVDGGKVFLIDFNSSLVLKLVLLLFKYKILYFTEYMRNYSRQTLLEWDIIMRFLSYKKNLLSTINDNFSDVKISYDLWHFYLSAKK